MAESAHIPAQPRRSSKAKIALVSLSALAIVVSAATALYVRALGPLDVSAATRGSTIAVDREGHLLRAFTTEDGRWRLPIKVADVDPRFFRLLFAYEDHRFHSHHGVDPLAMARAAEQLIFNGHVVSGGSTITMQVARLLEPRDDRNISAKARQVVRAFQLEEKYSKDEILDFYLALAPYGGNLEGLRAASLAYFGKEPKRLTDAEAALLVALPQSPESRRPDRAPDAARRARDRVLDRAVERGALPPAEAQAAKADPVPRARKQFPMLAPHATESGRRATPDRRVMQFTYDGHLQAALETLARDSVTRLGPKLSIAMIAIDNATGEVRAHVGGAEYLSSDRAGGVDLANAIRSPGSALKPFIYALAFENGLAHPETILEDRRARFGVYAPENFDLTFQGQVTARVALQQSLNIPAITLLNEVGPRAFIARLRNAGADIVMSDDSAPGLAVGLGGLGVRLVDLTRLYAGLARGGRTPDLVERLDMPRASTDRRITEPVAAWYVFDTLRGAPPPANASGGHIAFKTGTSYGYRDAFAVGYDRNTTIGIWVGRADNGPTPGLVGRAVAAPILFDAFARLGGEREPIRPPRDVVFATSAKLPPPLRHLRKDAPKTTTATAIGSLKIAYPPDGARIDLGLDHPPDARLALKVQGGAPPFTWMVNGAPVGEPDLRRQSQWRPDGAGFARVSIIDSRGASDSVMVRLE
jgi:penicillin-binding protein 1C